MADVYDGQVYAADGDACKLAMRRGEHVKDLLTRVDMIDDGQIVVLTNLRIMKVSRHAKVVAEGEYVADGGSLKLVGTFGACLLLQDKDYVYYCASFDGQLNLRRLFAADSINERLVSLLPDRAVMAHSVLDDKDKEVKLDIMQRHCYSTELLLLPYAYGLERLTGKEIESLVSIFWDSSFSEIFLKKYASKANSKVDMEFVYRYGGIDYCFEQQIYRLKELPSEVLDFLKVHAKEFLNNAGFNSEPVTEIASKYRLQVNSESIRQNIEWRLKVLSDLSLIPASCSIKEADEILKSSGEIKRNRILKKKEVAFGSDTYK